MHEMDDRTKQQRDRLGGRFDAEAWPVDDGGVVVKGFDFGPDDIPGYRLHRVVSPPARPGTVAARQSVWVDETKPAEEDAIVLVDVYECASNADARNVLLDLLGEIESAEVERIDGVGSVAFSPGEGSVLFVRGNLAVQVQSGGPGVASVRDNAQGFDARLRDPRSPGKSEDVGP